MVMSNQEPFDFEDLEPEAEGSPFEESGKLSSIEGFDDDKGYLARPFEDDDLDDADFSSFVDEFDELDDDGLVDGFEDDFDDETGPAFEAFLKDQSRHQRKSGLAGKAARAAFISSNRATALPASHPKERAYELMKVLAAAAASTKSQVEAERLIAAIVPISLWADSTAGRSIWQALPALIQGASGLVGFLHKRASTRPLIETVPAILVKTVKQLTSDVAQGRPVTRRMVARLLAQQTAAALSRNKTRRVRRSHRPARNKSSYTDDVEWWDGNGHGA